MHIYVYIHIYICILLYIYAYYLASSPRFSSTVCPNPPCTPSGRTSPYAPRPRCRTSSKSSGTNCGKLYHAAPTFQNHGFWAYLWIHTYLKIDIDICFLFFLFMCVYVCTSMYIYIYIDAYAFAKIHGGSQWVCIWLNGTHFTIIKLKFNNGSTKGLHGLIYSILMYNQETSVS